MTRRLYAMLLASVLVLAAVVGVTATASAQENSNTSACPYFSSFLNEFGGTSSGPALRALTQDCASKVPSFTHAAATACSVPSTTYPTIASAFADANCSEVDLASQSYNAIGIEVSHDVTLFGNGARINRATAGTVFTVDSGVTFNVQEMLFSDAWYGSHAITNYGTLNVTQSAFVGVNVKNPTAPAPDGGAIMDFGTGTTVSASVFVTNLGSLAGAIAHESNAPLTILSSAFVANGRGISIAGAVYSNGGALDIENSLFAFNDTIFGDRAVVVDGGTYTHTGNVFLFND